MSWKIDDRCPGVEALAAISDKWKASIVASLGDASEPVRFASLQRKLAPVSRKVLAEALHQLEIDGVVARKAYAEVPPRVEYWLTERGLNLIPILRSLHDWQTSSVDVKDRLPG